MRVRRICSTLVSWLLLACAVASVLPPAHHHGLDGALPGESAISLHACGALERHVPLESFEQCPACRLSMQRMGFPVSPDAPSLTVDVVGAVIPFTCDVPRSSFLLLPDRRGPPFSV